MTRLVLVCASLIAIVACGSDDASTGSDLVGGACAANSDCEYRCQLGGDFPQGTCVKPCNVDGDCPDGAYCINIDGGICLLACTTPSDCRGGYNCQGKENRTHGGDSLVCIN